LNSHHARRYALVPLLQDEPVGVERLLQLAANASAKTLTPKEI
jgi:hypothetical protein